MTAGQAAGLAIALLMLASAILAYRSARLLITDNREARAARTEGRTPAIDRKVEYGIRDFDRRIAALLYGGDPR